MRLCALIYPEQCCSECIHERRGFISSTAFWRTQCLVFSNVVVFHMLSPPFICREDEQKGCCYFVVGKRKGRGESFRIDLLSVHAVERRAFMQRATQNAYGYTCSQQSSKKINSSSLLSLSLSLSLSFLPSQNYADLFKLKNSFLATV